MHDPSLTLQRVIRDRLIAADDVCAIVPADHILDSNGRPERSPCILIGEGQALFRRFNASAYATLHIWVQEAGLVTAKTLASAIVAALRLDAQRDGVLHVDGWTCHDIAVTQTRFLRDPHGEWSHGIVDVAAVMTEAA